MNTCRWHVPNKLRWQPEGLTEEVKNLSRPRYRSATLSIGEGIAASPPERGVT